MTREADPDLWARYRRGDAEAYEALAESYLPLVKITIGRMAMHLPSFLEYEELYSTGCMGLLSALEKYDPSREAKFSTYAITRIRGAVIDELRSHDLLGRVTRDRVGRIRQAEETLRAAGQVVSGDSVAEEAGLTLDEYYDAVRGDRASRTVSLSELVADGSGEQSLAEMLESKGFENLESLGIEDMEILEEVASMLTDREKLLVTLYYHEELTLKEVGSIMEVSESRVSQLHAEMLERIRNHLKKIGV